MNDIVKRLRERAGQNDEYAWHIDIELEAADEIERLRSEIPMLEDEKSTQYLPPKERTENQELMDLTMKKMLDSIDIEVATMVGVKVERERCAKICEQQRLAANGDYFAAKIRGDSDD